MAFLIQDTSRKILAENRPDAGDTASDSFFVEGALIAGSLPTGPFRRSQNPGGSLFNAY